MQLVLPQGFRACSAGGPKSRVAPQSDAAVLRCAPQAVSLRTQHARTSFYAGLGGRSVFGQSTRPRTACLVQAGPDSQKTGGEEKRTRRLILLRHAESEGRSSGVKDYSRQVTEVGKKGAELVAEMLVKRGWIPDYILCSPSKRTRQTLEAMALSMEAFRKVDVKYIESFYSVAALDGHTRAALETAISEEDADGRFQTVMCMGHNKGWEEAASSFAGTAVKLDTSNAALLVGEGATWAEAFANGFALSGLVAPDNSRATSS